MLEKEKDNPDNTRKIVRCAHCGKKLDDNSAETQREHRKATGHRLYREILNQ